MAFSENLPMIASVLVFGSVLFFFAGIYTYSQYRKSRSRMLAKIKLDGKTADPEMADIASSKTDPITNLLGAVGERVKPEKPEQLKQRSLDFLRAGIRKKNALAVFWGGASACWRYAFQHPFWL